MANAFLKLWDNVVNKPAQALQKDVKELRKQQFDKDIKAEQQKQKNQQEWNKYLNKGKAIDYNDFDAKVVDLPKENENEKQIKIDRTPQVFSSTPINTGVSDDNNELEMLAGNAIPEKPEQKNPSVTLDNKIDDEDNELEMLAGNGVKLPPPEEQNVDTITPDNEEDSEPSVEADDNADGIDREDLFDKEPEVEGEPDVPVELSDKEAEQIEKDVKEEEKKKKEEDKETSDTEESESENTTEEESDNSEKSESESKTEKTETSKSPSLAKQALAKALTDKGGLSVSDMVENVSIPHYNYLSLFK